jgi:hemolysin-activating ACP:hemolysin acyltransferase
MKKISLWLTGVGTAIASAVLPAITHAQFVLASSTESANNGTYLTIAYNELINFLTSTGGVLFMIVLTILGIVVWLAVKAPRHVVNS